MAVPLRWEPVGCWNSATGRWCSGYRWVSAAELSALHQPHYPCNLPEELPESRISSKNIYSFENVQICFGFIVRVLGYLYDHLQQVKDYEVGLSCQVTTDYGLLIQLCFGSEETTIVIKTKKLIFSSRLGPWRTRTNNEWEALQVKQMWTVKWRYYFTLTCPACRLSGATG